MLNRLLDWLITRIEKRLNQRKPEKPDLHGEPFG